MSARQLPDETVHTTSMKETRHGGGLAPNEGSCFFPPGDCMFSL